MKLPTIMKTFASAVVLLLAANAFAADNASKGSLEVVETLSVSGHQLAPGEYQVRWEGANPSVELRILSQGKLVATVPAQVIKLSQAGWANAVESSASADGPAPRGCASPDDNKFLESADSARSASWRRIWCATIAQRRTASCCC